MEIKIKRLDYSIGDRVQIMATGRTGKITSIATVTLENKILGIAYRVNNRGCYWYGFQLLRAK